jgi:hypothetical protein
VSINAGTQLVSIWNTFVFAHSMLSMRAKYNSDLAEGQFTTYSTKAAMSVLPFRVPNKPEELETDDLGAAETLRVERRNWESLDDEEVQALAQGRKPVLEDHDL